MTAPKAKTFEEKFKENPDSFDYPDCMPGPANLSPEYADRITPDYIREAIAERKRKAMAKK